MDRNRFVVSDAVWAKVADLLPGKATDPGATGKDNRLFLEAAIRRHIEATNADPHPFVWTKSADDILDSVRRFCQRTTDVSQRQEISNSAH